MVTIRNMSEMPLLFKVKTTSPNNYLVKPNQGVCLQGQSSVVRVTFQFPIDSPQEKTAIEGDKFLVQVCPSSNPGVTLQASSAELTALWADMTKAQILQYKLRIKERKKSTIAGSLGAI